ncbi:MAG: TraB family protein [Candidatus Altiarchaeales archaeon]|nr:TraB family protein [Candidatus Altiarchaeales archaeon]
MRELEYIEVEDKKIWLLGTAHVSEESSRQVREAIEELEPEVVCVELCESRLQALREEKRWDETDLGEVLSSGKTPLFIAQLFFANYQRRIGDKLGIQPGAEMLSAVKSAEEKNIPVELVDQNVNITLGRAYQGISGREKIKLLINLFEGFFEGEEEITPELVEKLREKDMLTEILDELASEMPSLKKALVDERDEYIASKILSLEYEKIFVVVGAGHIEGIKKTLKELEHKTKVVYQKTGAQDTKDRRGLGRKIKMIGYVIPAVFLILIASSFIKHGSEITVNLLVLWFLINGTLSALAAAAVLAHPATILSSFLAAPFTSLNPALAAGWVAGYVELKLRKPRVGDFKDVMRLNSLRDWLTNRVTRVILLVALVNLGSTAGTLIALPYIASLI